MIKLRFTITGTYEAQPKDYATEDSIEMAKIDEKNFDPETGNFDLNEIAEWSDDLTVKVEPV